MIDEILDFFADAWEYIWDAILYIFSFEWFGDFWEFIGSMFEGLGELSITGIVLGVVGAGTVYLARDYMLQPFLVHFSPVMAIIWGIVTYIGTFMAGYLLGKGFDNTG